MNFRPFSSPTSSLSDLCSLSQKSVRERVVTWAPEKESSLPSVLVPLVPCVCAGASTYTLLLVAPTLPEVGAWLT